ncbi:MAG: hypothetical protein HY909_09785 [Deltaproteobacteria bacterium]|nr:hypothetical protein [Deltaproteobacteria bacterium]
MDVVADCDALTVALVHLALASPVEQLLRRCGRQLRTLEVIYRREAQGSLRECLDQLVRAEVCTLAPGPDEQRLERRQKKRHARIHRLAEQRFRTTSQHDRDLLWLADDAAAVLATHDGPLGRLAREHGTPVVDVLDVLVALFTAELLVGEDLDRALAKEAARCQTAEDALRRLFEARGASPVLVCVGKDEGARVAATPEGDV